ncbi:MAG TPA: hypothetical protein VFY79_10480, partial [Dehalococcoidia bacterium]|nr:hypothetical protein [Dehalococcoidia bacterium]
MTVGFCPSHSTGFGEALNSTLNGCGPHVASGGLSGGGLAGQPPGGIVGSHGGLASPHDPGVDVGVDVGVRVGVGVTDAGPGVPVPQMIV